jgi:hypothetical protein
MKILPSFLVTAFLVGTVSLAAAKPVRPSNDNKPTKHERLVARFDRIDTDDDGMISRAEFIAFRKDHKAKHPKKAGKNAKQLRRAKHAKAVKAAKAV